MTSYFIWDFLTRYPCKLRKALHLPWKKMQSLFPDLISMWWAKYPQISASIASQNLIKGKVFIMKASMCAARQERKRRRKIKLLVLDLASREKRNIYLFRESDGRKSLLL